jgi:hypothetical protein
MVNLTEQDIKCLRKHLKPLLQILEKLDEGALVAPKSKPETVKQGVNRYLNLIEEREARKLRK